MRGFRHWRWHLDEMYVKLNGEMVYLWRAVDHEGEILESDVTRTRDKFVTALVLLKQCVPTRECYLPVQSQTISGPSQSSTQTGHKGAVHPHLLSAGELAASPRNRVVQKSAASIAEKALSAVTVAIEPPRSNEMRATT